MTSVASLAHSSVPETGSSSDAKNQLPQRTHQHSQQAMDVDHDMSASSNVTTTSNEHELRSSASASPVDGPVTVQGTCQPNGLTSPSEATASGMNKDASPTETDARLSHRVRELEEQLSRYQCLVWRLRDAGVASDILDAFDRESSSAITAGTDTHDVPQSDKSTGATPPAKQQSCTTASPAKTIRKDRRVMSPQVNRRPRTRSNVRKQEEGGQPEVEPVGDKHANDAEYAACTDSAHSTRRSPRTRGRGNTDMPCTDSNQELSLCESDDAPARLHRQEMDQSDEDGAPSGPETDADMDTGAETDLANESHDTMSTTVGAASSEEDAPQTRRLDKKDRGENSSGCSQADGHADKPSSTDRAASKPELMTTGVQGTVASVPSQVQTKPAPAASTHPSTVQGSGVQAQVGAVPHTAVVAPTAAAATTTSAVLATAGHVPTVPMTAIVPGVVAGTMMTTSTTAAAGIASGPMALAPAGRTAALPSTAVPTSTTAPAVQVVGTGVIVPGAVPMVTVGAPGCSAGASAAASAAVAAVVTGRNATTSSSTSFGTKAPKATKKERTQLVAKCTEPRPGQTRYWTEEEHDRFLEAVARHGEKAYVAISNYVETRTPKQVRTHAQKFQMKMARLAKTGGVLPGGALPPHTRGSSKAAKAKAAAAKAAAAAAAKAGVGAGADAGGTASDTPVVALPTAPWTVGSGGVYAAATVPTGLAAAGAPVAGPVAGAGTGAGSGAGGGGADAAPAAVAAAAAAAAVAQATVAYTLSREQLSGVDTACGAPDDGGAFSGAQALAADGLGAAVDGGLAKVVVADGSGGGGDGARDARVDDADAAAAGDAVDLSDPYLTYIGGVTDGVGVEAAPVADSANEEFAQELDDLEDVPALGALPFASPTDDWLLSDATAA